MLLQILKYSAGIATLLTGMISLLWPLKILGFTGLNVVGGRGVTEIRAILGGFFIGLGAAVLLLNVQAAYQTLGIAYLVVAVVRAISMLIDKSVVQSNIISVITEVILGVILII